MRQASAKVWIIGTAVLAVLLLAAAWLLAVDPVLARAAEDTTQTESQRQQNDLLGLEIIKLQEEATHLDEYKAELAAMRLQMPTTGDGASISRELESLAEAAGVTILSVAPSQPQEFVATVTVPLADAAVPSEEAATDEPGAAEDGTTDESGTDTTVSTGIPGFYTIPITLSTVGSYEGSVAFLRSVQVAASRLYLVSSITATTQEAQGANGGRPATNAGDIELTITGYAFVLSDSSVVLEPEADAGEPLPVPGAQGNPFAPVG